MTRLTQRATTGIDRIDLAYARHFARHAVPATIGTQYGLFGPHVLGNPEMRALVDCFERAQREDDRSAGPEWLSLCAKLLDEKSSLADQSAARRLPGHRHSVLLQARLRTLQNPLASVPNGAIYLNVAQHAFEHFRFFRWLDRRSDVVPVFLVHDLLPMDYPEFFPRGYETRFQRRVETIMRRVRAIVTTTTQVSERIEAEYRHRKLGAPPIHTEPVPSPLEDAPEVDKKDSERVSQICYFVAISTLEPRKNHLFLFNLWRELMKGGGATPKLVLVGQRGWGNEQILRELHLAPDLKGHVVETHSLPAAHLRSLLKNARALLMPSFAEGYGLPIVEALSLRTPVICSDIAVFRETSQGKARLISPVDGRAWLKAIKELAAPDSLLRTQLCEKALEFQSPTWSRYFKEIELFLARL